MASKKRKHNISMRIRASDVQITSCDLEAAEAILARLVARAFAADHPELFSACKQDRKGDGEGCV